MTVPAKVLELIDLFRRNADAYHAPSYNEAMARQEFINPFFKCLGWDMDNEQGYAEAYKDVIHEAAIKIGGATKAPDYCFRIGGTPKLYLEAKRPSVNLRDDPAPAYQLRRYAWTGKLSLSILTDFEEFAVYDCRIKPAHTDKASVARILYLRYEDYADRWDEIAGVFSREAILKGSFDKFADTKKSKRGTAPVDVAFLQEIEAWRESLARNLALRNPQLSQRELNYAVQVTIDRVIFLRMCEDRGIEPYGQLQKIQQESDIYAHLLDLYRKADDRYNSGLFHFHAEKDRPEAPDALTPTLALDDKPLKEILRGLYYPESPYEFSVLSGEILGQVYEQFLGKVIRLTAGHQAKVEDKPEVRKAGGVYYTPTYIVEYIVKQTVGKLLGEPAASASRSGEPAASAAGLTPKQAAKLRILDPACGSGSFLLGAYQLLLDWHRDYYIQAGPKKHTKELYQAAGGVWRLTTAEKKRILLANIYGVDIDPQAVEVTKLSLLLKVLEGESEQTLQSQLQMFHERALPDLSSNIQCGNSLIGPDFYDGQQLDLFDEEERYRINVFDWHAAFPSIMKAGGFDVVIGNPPYIRVRYFRQWYPEQVDYLESRYRCATHVWDIYLLFCERAVELLRTKGRGGFILPIQTLHQPNCESLRALLLSKTSIQSIIDLSGIKVFQGPIVKNCILVWERNDSIGNIIDTSLPNSPEDLLGQHSGSWPQASVSQNPGYSMKLDLLSPKKLLCEKFRLKSWELGQLCYVTFGLRSCAKGRGQGNKKRLITDDGMQTAAKPYLEGRDICRYGMHPTGHFIRYIPSEMYSPRTPALFEAKKIVSQSMLSKMRLVATIDESGYYVEQSLVCIIHHGILTEKNDAASVPLEFILGVINSRLESFYFGTAIIDYSLGGGLIHATPGSQAKLLVPRVSESQWKPIITTVQQMLSLQKQLAAAKTPQEQTMLQRQIDATDRQIDRLVYELYGLTEAEIEIVEAAKP